MLTKHLTLYCGALLTMASVVVAYAERTTYYFYGRAGGGGLLMFGDASNWRPETVPPSDYSAPVVIAAQGKPLDCSIDGNDPWKLSMLVIGGGVGPVTIEGNKLAFQNLDDAPKVFLLCEGAVGEQTILADILLEGNGGEQTALQFGGGEILIEGKITATGPALGLILMTYPRQVVTLRGVIEDKTDLGLVLTAKAGRLVLDNVANDFRGPLSIGGEEGTEIVATTVADAGKPSSIGSGELIRFGLGYGKKDSEFVLKVTGPGPQTTDREIEIVGNVDLAIPARAVLFSEVTEAGVVFSGNISSTRFQGDSLLVLDGLGNGTVSGIIGSRIMGLQKRGSGTWTISNPANELNGDVSVENGELRLQGGTGTPLGGANVECSAKGVLSGEGTLQGSLNFIAGGTFLSGSGNLSVLGSVRFDTGSVFEFVPGGKGQLEAGEGVTIAEAVLVVRAGGVVAAPRGEVVLIKSDKPADGSFQGLPEGAAVKVGNASASISYKRGVVLKFP